MRSTSSASSIGAMMRMVTLAVGALERIDLLSLLIDSGLVDLAPCIDGSLVDAARLFHAPILRAITMVVSKKVLRNFHNDSPKPIFSASPTTNEAFMTIVKILDKCRKI